MNKHRDTWSFLRAAAEPPTLLTEDIKVSLEFEFETSDGKKRRQECLCHNRAGKQKRPGKCQGAVINADIIPQG